MRPHGRIDANGREVFDLATSLVVEQYTHAVQSLKLERGLADRGSSHRKDGADRVGVMRGELRVDKWRGGDQLPSAREIRHVSRALARVDGVLRQAAFLCTLDLAVPVRAFDEAYGQRAAQLACESEDVIDDLRRAPTIGLHRETESRPVAHHRVARQGADEFER